jgi:hypothetical protein
MTGEVGARLPSAPMGVVIPSGRLSLTLTQLSMLLEEIDRQKECRSSMD